MLRFIVLLCFLLPFASFAEGAGSYAMFGSEDGELTISYNIDEQGQVFRKMLDIVRGGHTVEITHNVAIYNKPGWRNKQVRRVLAQRFLSYDPLTDKFSISSATRTLQYDLTPEEAAQKVFTISNLRLSPLKVVEPAGEYPVKIKIDYSVEGADKSLLDIVSLKGVWGQKTVKAEVTYIAR
jgi:hypothetical protein